ncbi:hypothetical protein HDU96_000825 [Phlyctochytrium bullatum]|nr:hypothetical protein HDU96_000825 [Phlyctochytrium bullatum]
MFVAGRKGAAAGASGGSDIAGGGGGIGLGHGGEVQRHAPPQLAEYPTTLNLYAAPPTDEITLQDFELFALDRLYVLKGIENCLVRNRSHDDTARIVRALGEKYLPMASNNQLRAMRPHDMLEQRRKDHLSHFILRLAFCRTEDNRAWFLRQETALFKHRFDDAPKSEKELLLSLNNLDFELLSMEDRRAFAPELRALHGEKADQTFYRVPFERVLPLVAKRMVLLSKGFAFVPESEISVVVTSIFKESLQRSVEATARMIPRMEEDDRLIPVLNSVARQCISREYNVNVDPNNPNQIITEGEVEPLAKAGHFPLCMSNLVTHLHADGHLRHFGRLQLGLFLKGIGVPLEEALVYWKRAFHKLTEDKFNKEHAYNIRFNYGREGSRKDYSPFSCQRIITTNAPGPGDYHGCPFRHTAPDVLRSLALKAGTTESEANELLRLSKEGHYQIACTRMFEMTRGAALKELKKTASQPAAAAGSATQPGTQAGGTQASANPDLQASIFASDGSLAETIEHPNQYFDLSYRGSSNRKNRRSMAPTQNQTQQPMDEDDAMDVDR